MVATGKSHSPLFVKQIKKKKQLYIYAVMVSKKWADKLLLCRFFLSKEKRVGFKTFIGFKETVSRDGFWLLTCMVSFRPK
jgi:hypothetical protein